MIGGSREYGMKIYVRKELDGNNLTSYYLSPQASVCGWITFDFPDIPVYPGRKYYIIWDPDDGGEGAYGLGTGYGYNGGEAWIYNGKEWHYFCNKYTDFAFKTYGRMTKPKPPIIDGPNSSIVGLETVYTITATDPDGDDIYYFVDWGDNTSSGWIGAYKSGESINLSHMWNTGGDYIIEAKVKDTWGIESNWSVPFHVHISAPILEIEEVTSSFGRIRMEIRNNGDSKANNVKWSIAIEGFVSNPYTEGTIDTLEASNVTWVESQFIFGLGGIAVTCKVDEYSKNISGMCIGPFIKLEGNEK